MQDSTVNRMLSMITVLANKLNTTADHLWGVLTKQAQVLCLEWIINAIIVTLVGVLLYKLNKYFIKLCKNHFFFSLK